MHKQDRPTAPYFKLIEDCGHRVCIICVSQHYLRCPVLSAAGALSALTLAPAVPTPEVTQDLSSHEAVNSVFVQLPDWDRFCARRGEAYEQAYEKEDANAMFRLVKEWYCEKVSVPQVPRPENHACTSQAAVETRAHRTSHRRLSLRGRSTSWNNWPHPRIG